MATIANLDVNLRANTGRFDRGIQSAANTVRNFSLALVGSGASLAAGINHVVQRFATAGDAIAKQSKQLQISASDYQSLTYAIERNGGSQTALVTGIRGLTRNYFDLERGLSTAKESFAELGIAQQDLRGLAIADQFRLVVERLGTIEDEAKRAAVAQKLLGRSALELLPLIDGLKDAEDGYRALGVEVGPDALRISEEIKDANLDLQRSLQGVSASIVESFGPAIVDFTNYISELLRTTSRGIAELQRQIIRFRFGYNIQQATPIALEGAREFERAARQPPRRTLPDTIDTSTVEAQIDAQRQLIDVLRDTASNLAPLPQVFERGTSAQIGFINNLRQQERQNEIRAQEQRKISLAEQQLRKLEDLLREQQEANQRALDLQEGIL